MTSTALHLSASLAVLSRARAWREMASGERKIGKVVTYGGGKRHKIDFGRRWGPRYLYSYHGVRFETHALAEAILHMVQGQVAKNRLLSDVLSEFAPQASAESAVEKLMPRWLSLFRDMVEAGDRQPRTLREYERWARPEGRNQKKPENHFAWWYGRTIWDVDRGSLKEWSYFLAKRGLTAKTRRNVMAGFSSFLSYVEERRGSFKAPEMPWPESDERIPTVLTLDVRDQVLEAILESKRGIYLAMAWAGVRPSEARVLRVRDWIDDEIRVERAAKDRRVLGLVRGTKKRRGAKVVPVAAPVRAWLRRHVSAERRVSDPDGPLFVNPDPQSMTGWWSDTGVRRVWYTACRKVGVRVSLYEGTKHTLGTALKAAGEDDRVIAMLFGHSDARSVEPYARVQTTTVRSAVSRLARRKGAEDVDAL